MERTHHGLSCSARSSDEGKSLSFSRLSGPHGGDGPAAASPEFGGSSAFAAETNGSNSPSPDAINGKAASQVGRNYAAVVPAAGKSAAAEAAAGRSAAAEAAADRSAAAEAVAEMSAAAGGAAAIAAGAVAISESWRGQARYPPLMERGGFFPGKGHRVGLHIVLFEACSAFISRCGLHTLARSPYFVTRYPKASDISSPPCLLRLLPAGAVAGWHGTHLGKRRLFTAHTQSGNYAYDSL